MPKLIAVFLVVDDAVDGEKMASSLVALAPKNSVLSDSTVVVSPDQLKLYRKVLDCKDALVRVPRQQKLV